jgi:hypothetical protein
MKFKVGALVTITGCVLALTTVGCGPTGSDVSGDTAAVKRGQHNGGSDKDKDSDEAADEAAGYGHGHHGDPEDDVDAGPGQAGAGGAGGQGGGSAGSAGSDEPSDDADAGTPHHHGHDCKFPGFWKVFEHHRKHDKLGGGRK